jgi:hypothetical protein
MSPSVGVNCPRALVIPLSIDGHDEALTAKGLGRFVNDVRCLYGSGVDANLVRTSKQHLTHVGHSPDTAANGEGHETARRSSLDHIDHGLALLVAGRDVEEDEFISALLIVQLGALHRVSCVTKLEKLGAFHDTPLLHVEAGDNSFGQHGRRGMKHAAECLGKPGKA